MNWFMKMFKRKRWPYEYTVYSASRMSGKTFDTMNRYINAVKSKKTAIMIGKDYVVLSKEMYIGLMRRSTK